MAKKKRSTNGSGKIYGSYVFRDKEPSIDVFRTLVEDVNGERVSHKALAAIEKAGGPSAGCMAAWVFGKTRRPQNASMEAAGRALGYHRPWVKMKK